MSGPYCVTAGPKVLWSLVDRDIFILAPPKTPSWPPDSLIALQKVCGRTGSRAVKATSRYKVVGEKDTPWLNFPPLGPFRRCKDSPSLRWLGAAKAESNIQPVWSGSKSQGPANIGAQWKQSPRRAKWTWGDMDWTELDRVGGVSRAILRSSVKLPGLSHQPRFFQAILKWRNSQTSSSWDGNQLLFLDESGGLSCATGRTRSLIILSSIIHW